MGIIPPELPSSGGGTTWGPHNVVISEDVPGIFRHVITLVKDGVPHTDPTFIRFYGIFGETEADPDDYVADAFGFSDGTLDTFMATTPHHIHAYLTPDGIVTLDFSVGTTGATHGQIVIVNPDGSVQKTTEVEF